MEIDMCVCCVCNVCTHVSISVKFHLRMATVFHEWRWILQSYAMKPLRSSIPQQSNISPLSDRKQALFRCTVEMC
jgi:hypothetical protein